MAKALCLVDGNIVLQDINSATWGSISGTLSSQTDLNTALTSKIDKTIGTAKGDIISFSSSGVPANVSVGTNGQVLTADSAQTNGIKWANASSSETYNFQTLSGNLVLDDSSATNQFLKTGGINRFVTLPTTGINIGKKFYIFNADTYNTAYYLDLGLPINCCINAQCGYVFIWNGTSWLYEGMSNICIGVSLASNYGYAIAIGNSAYNNFTYGVGIGYNAKNNYNDGVGIGLNSKDNYTDGVGIGPNSYSNYNNGVGVGSQAYGNYSNGVGIGVSSINNNMYGVGIGSNARCNSKQYCTVAIGSYSKAERNREIVSASHDNSTPLSMLTIQKYKYKDITTAAWNEMFVDASSARLSILAKSAYTFRAQIVAFDYTNYKAKSWEITGLIRRDNSNNTVLIASTVSVIAADTEAATWDARITADDTNEALKLEVYGEAGKTIRFTANIFATEVRN